LLLHAEVDAVDAGAVLADLEGYGTCMWLDLKPDCDRQRLPQQLSSISPFMLLNLRQLRWAEESIRRKPVSCVTLTGGRTSPAKPQ
jgi:hypothetical protein